MSVTAPLPRMTCSRATSWPSSSSTSTSSLDPAACCRSTSGYSTRRPTPSRSWAPVCKPNRGRQHQQCPVADLNILWQDGSIEHTALQCSLAGQLSCLHLPWTASYPCLRLICIEVWTFEEDFSSKWPIFPLMRGKLHELCRITEAVSAQARTRTPEWCSLAFLLLPLM